MLTQANYNSDPAAFDQHAFHLNKLHWQLIQCYLRGENVETKVAVIKKCFPIILPPAENFYSYVDLTIKCEKIVIYAKIFLEQLF